MADPVKMIFDDGSELAMVRCPNCKCPRSVDYRCSGCEAQAWRRAYQTLRDGIAKAQSDAHQVTP